jgi:hypothetical protein
VPHHRKEAVREDLVGVQQELTQVLNRVGPHDSMSSMIHIDCAPHHAQRFVLTDSSVCSKSFKS